MDAVLERARRIRLLVLDVDGVLTDGRLYISAAGEELKVFHVRDGSGLVAIQRAGRTPSSTVQVRCPLRPPARTSSSKVAPAASGAWTAPRRRSEDGCQRGQCTGAHA